MSNGKVTKSAEIAQEALSNAINNQSLANYATIIEGFAAKGIPLEDIKPRENVFTFWAWKALGRSVKKGEHGVKVITRKVVNKTRERDGEEKTESYSIPWTATVFHVSQTESEHEAKARKFAQATRDEFFGETRIQFGEVA